MERLISTLKKFTGSEEDQGLFSAFFQGPDGNDSDDSSSSDSDDGEYGLEYNVRGEEQFEKPLALSISDSVSVDSGSGKSISSKSKKKKRGKGSGKGGSNSAKDKEGNLQDLEYEKSNKAALAFEKELEAEEREKVERDRKKQSKKEEKQKQRAQTQLKDSSKNQSKASLEKEKQTAVKSIAASDKDKKKTDSQSTDNVKDKDKDKSEDEASDSDDELDLSKLVSRGSSATSGKKANPAATAGTISKRKSPPFSNSESKDSKDKDSKAAAKPPKAVEVDNSDSYYSSSFAAASAGIDNIVAQLIGMGFSEALSRQAVKRHGKDIDAAISYLCSNSNACQSSAIATPAHGHSSASASPASEEKKQQQSTQQSSTSSTSGSARTTPSPQTKATALSNQKDNQRGGRERERLDSSQSSSSEQDLNFTQVLNSETDFPTLPQSRSPNSLRDAVPETKQQTTTSTGNEIYSVEGALVGKVSENGANGVNSYRVNQDQRHSQFTSAPPGQIQLNAPIASVAVAPDPSSFNPVKNVNTAGYTIQGGPGGAQPQVRIIQVPLHQHQHHPPGIYGPGPHAMYQQQPHVLQPHKVMIGANGLPVMQLPAGQPMYAVNAQPRIVVGNPPPGHIQMMRPPMVQQIVSQGPQGQQHSIYPLGAGMPYNQQIQQVQQQPPQGQTVQSNKQQQHWVASSREGVGVGGSYSNDPNASVGVNRALADEASMMDDYSDFDSRATNALNLSAQARSFIPYNTHDAHGHVGPQQTSQTSEFSFGELPHFSANNTTSKSNFGLSFESTSVSVQEGGQEGGHSPNSNHKFDDDEEDDESMAMNFNSLLQDD